MICEGAVVFILTGYTDCDWLHNSIVSIFSGTKWCGPGHIAKTYDELGTNRETDKCCREHDRHCKIRIKGGRKKYGLWNLSWKTASHCDCEVKFKKCLDKVSVYSCIYVISNYL